MTNEIVIRRDDRDIRKKPWLVRWYSDYDPTTDTRKRHCRSFATRKLAERFVDELKYNLQNGLSQDKKAITLGDFCQKFLDAKSNRYKHGTLMNYQYTIQRLLAYFNPNTPLSQIDTEFAEQFINDIDYIRADLINKNTIISDSFRNIQLRNCKKLFSTAVGWKYLLTNPFEELSQVKPRKKKWYYISPTDFQAILRACTNPMKRAYYCVQYGCGLRAGETMNVLWSGNIDLINKKLSIYNRLPTPEIPPYNLKDYEPRIIPLPDWVVTELKTLKESFSKGNPFVFLSEKRWKTTQSRWKRMQAEGTGSQWDPQLMLSNALMEFQRCCRKAGIRTTLKLCLHCLRKSWATNLAGAGVPIQTLMKLGGWSSIECCQEYYLQSTDQNEKFAVEILNKMVKVGSEQGLSPAP